MTPVIVIVPSVITLSEAVSVVWKMTKNSAKAKKHILYQVISTLISMSKSNQTDAQIRSAPGKLNIIPRMIIPPLQQVIFCMNSA